ncbi:hypothetical protein Afe04nite_56160 [Asanoa ferruginea]|nr:hypothetical protein Afe04nite_56160 [Asanoa ferruginea]
MGGVSGVVRVCVAIPPTGLKARTDHAPACRRSGKPPLAHRRVAIRRVARFPQVTVLAPASGLGAVADKMCDTFRWYREILRLCVTDSPHVGDVGPIILGSAHPFCM